MSQWAALETNAPLVSIKSFRLLSIDTHEADSRLSHQLRRANELYNWLREIRIVFISGRLVSHLLTLIARSAFTDISDTCASLNLWTETIVSQFQLQSVPVKLATTVHPTLDCWP